MNQITQITGNASFIIELLLFKINQKIKTNNQTIFCGVFYKKMTPRREKKNNRAVTKA